MALEGTRTQHKQVHAWNKVTFKYYVPKIYKDQIYLTHLKENLSNKRKVFLKVIRREINIL